MLRIFWEYTYRHSIGRRLVIPTETHQATPLLSPQRFYNLLVYAIGGSFGALGLLSAQPRQSYHHAFSQRRR
jgi:hypothetical protein